MQNMKARTYERAGIEGVDLYGLKYDENRIVFEGKFSNVAGAERGQQIYVSTVSVVYQDKAQTHGDWSAYLGAMVAADGTGEEDAMLHAARNGRKLTEREAVAAFPDLKEILEKKQIFYRD